VNRSRALPVAVLVGVAVVVLALYLAMNLALCRDGTFSLSAGQPGACSSHGGVVR
jgi:Protein of unknown function (DUF3761)